MLYEQKAPESSEPDEPSEPAVDTAQYEDVKAQVAEVETARDAAVSRAAKLEADLRAIRHQLQSSKDAQAINIRRLNDLESANAELGNKAKESETRAQTLELKIKQGTTENALVAGEAQKRISNLQEIVSQRDKQIKRMRSEITELTSDSSAVAEDASETTAPHLALVSGDDADDSDDAAPSSDRAAAGA